MYECLAYVQVCAPDVSGAGRGQKRGIGSPETRVRDGSQTQCESWKLNPGPLQKQEAL